MCCYCNKCGVCCKLIPLDEEGKMLLRDGMKPIDDSFFFALNPLTIEEAIEINEHYIENIQKIFPNVKFYTCKYLTEENLCSNVNKPEICELFPSHGLAFIPEDCGYNGKIFLENEKLKQKIRKIKEEIIDYETRIESKHPDSGGFKKIISVLEKSINKYKAYGSEEW